MAYTLEVSSPGMDRILFKPEQYQRTVSVLQIDVRLNYPFEGKKRISWVFLIRAWKTVKPSFEVEQDEYLLPLENVQRTRIVPQFD